MKALSPLSRLRIAGALRVLGLVAALQLLAFGLWLRSAQARARESLLSVGAELMQLPGAQTSAPARSVFVNGVTVHLRTATADQPLHLVLDRFHALCRARAGVDAPQDVMDKLRAHGTTVAGSPTAVDGVLRAESDSIGALACLDTGVPLSLDELVSRLNDFVKSGDLSQVGELRYVLARRAEGKTSVLTMWTEGSTPLLKMFPAVGDAPGQDPAGVPRAPGTRRVLSAWENGEPYSFAAYTCSGCDAGTLRAFYLDRLREDGWVVDVVRSRPSTIVAHRAVRTAVVRTETLSSGELATTVAVLD